MHSMLYWNMTDFPKGKNIYTTNLQQEELIHV